MRCEMNEVLLRLINTIWLVSMQTNQIKDVCTENLPSFLVFFNRLFLVVLLVYIKHIFKRFKKMEDPSCRDAVNKIALTFNIHKLTVGSHIPAHTLRLLFDKCCEQ